MMVFIMTRQSGDKIVLRDPAGKTVFKPNQCLEKQIEVKTLPAHGTDAPVLPVRAVQEKMIHL